MLCCACDRTELEKKIEYLSRVTLLSNLDNSFVQYFCGPISLLLDAFGSCKKEETAVGQGGLEFVSRSQS